MLSRIRAVAVSALQLGALKPIKTDVELVSAFGCAEGAVESEVNFAVRVVKNLIRKDAAAGRERGDPTKSVVDKHGSGREQFNPFLPYDASMFVQNIPPAHVLLLNKFNVVDDHVLLVTAEYEEQNSLLTVHDFHALWRVLKEVDGLAFYNAGRIAGASQHHKHLQVVCGQLASGLAQGKAPFECILAGKACQGEGFRVPQFEFVHAAVNMADCVEMDCEEAAKQSMARYTEALHKVMKQVENLQTKESTETRPFPYNLLITRKWMLMVPRREECFQGISVNSLGFAGCLLVRNHEQLDIIKTAGPMTVLQHTGFKLDTLIN